MQYYIHVSLLPCMTLAIITANVMTMTTPTRNVNWLDTAVFTTQFTTDEGDEETQYNLQRHNMTHNTTRRFIPIEFSTKVFVLL